MDREIWNLKSALDLCERMKSPMHNHGYLLTVYGSILCRESPRDLDLMLVPWRPSPMPPKMAFDSICERFKLSPAVGPPYIGLMRSWSHQASDREGRMIDFQFRTNCLELSQAEVDALVIAELQRRHPRALPISIDYESRTEGGFCHVWWVPYEDRKEVHPGL